MLYNLMDRRTARREWLGTMAAGSLLGQSHSLVRVGCVGVGSRGSYLLERLLRIPGVEIAALCDIHEARLEAARDKVRAAGLKAPEGFAGWRDLLARTDVAAVVSALPRHLHAAAYLDTIAAGKDLYGEKPMCITPAECDAVVAAAGKSRSIVQIGH